MRKTKTVNGVPHTYYYNGGTLLREVYGDTILDFFYNANGTPIAMRQSAVGSTNYTIYYYITNLQGDVIRLVDHEGRTAAYYRYDPYGKVIEASGSHANINPLRYRGYYYDVETELYYLQSRYYDPQVCRFINADGYVSTGQGLLGNNMFAYCGNNPVARIDSSGEFFFTLMGAITGFIGSVAVTAANNLFSGKNDDLITAGTQGALGGAISGAGVDTALLLIGSFGTALPVLSLAVGVTFIAGGIGNSYTTYLASNGTASDYDMGISFLVGGIANLFSLHYSTNCIASSVDDLFTKGNMTFSNNLKSGVAIATGTGIATAIGIGIDSKPTNNKYCVALR